MSGPGSFTSRRSGWPPLLNLVEHGSLWFLIVLVLLPLAMTMALLWKTKEVILDNVFGAKR